MRSTKTLARVVAALAIAAAPLAVAPAAATAETAVEITIGTGRDGTPEASVAHNVGDVDLVGTVKGAVAGTTFDLDGCAVQLDPATLTQGGGSFALSGCAGSDTAVRVDYRVAGDGTLVGTASAGGSGANREVTWSVECDVYFVLGFLPALHCKIKVTNATT